MNVLLYGVRWQDEKTLEFQASAKNTFGRKKIHFFDDVSFDIKSDIRCAGSRVDDVWTACPNQSQGKSKCNICRARERNFVFTAFDGFDRSKVSELDLERIAGPHIVYFALFDANMIKVGVSHTSRKLLRQIEQGAHFTLYIAETPDGIAARQIETLLRKDGMVDKIMTSQKKDFICPQITQSEGKKMLLEKFDYHKKVLDEVSHLQKFLFSQPKFQSWEHIYQLENIKQNSRHYHSVELKEGESVSGKLVAAKGHFLILETPDELVSLCTKDLIGRDIDFTPKPFGLHIRGALQNTLF
jgi:hypothetical protein